MTRTATPAASAAKGFHRMTAAEARNHLHRPGAEPIAHAECRMCCFGGPGSTDPREWPLYDEIDVACFEALAAGHEMPRGGRSPRCPVCAAAAVGLYDPDAVRDRSAEVRELETANRDLKARVAELESERAQMRKAQKTKRPEPPLTGQAD